MAFEPKRARRKVTARELGARFGVSERTVRRAVAEERADYEARAQLRRKQILELHQKGLGVRAISRTLGVSPALVSTRLKEAGEDGIPVPTPGDDA